MWIYSSKQGIKFAIPYSNIDYVELSIGEFTEQHIDASKRGTYYHSAIKKYFNDKVITILYRKCGQYNLFKGEMAFDKLSILSNDKF